MKKRPDRRVTDVSSSPTTPCEPKQCKILHPQCDLLIAGMFPPSTETANCTREAILKLSAVLDRGRTAFLSKAPRLLLETKVHALDNLIIRTPFHVFHTKLLIDLRRYLAVIAEALRSLSDEGEKLLIEHNTRNRWYYNGINNLNESLDTAGRNCPRNMEIELWDATFLLKHCQYILLSIKDTYTAGDRVAETGALLIQGTLQGYGSQWADAKDTLETIMRTQRSREPWHEVYLKLEAMCFKSLVPGLDSEIDGENVIEQAEKELKTVTELRNQFERGLSEKTDRLPSIVKTGLKILRQRLHKSGPYEKHLYYFEYGLLDLMYRLSFHVQARSKCFIEMIGAVRSALIWSHPDVAFFHRKATDLYHRINEIGTEVGVIYGEGSDRRLIDKWILDHDTEVEKPSHSKQYVPLQGQSNWHRRSGRILDEISTFQSEVAILDEEIKSNIPQSKVNVRIHRTPEHRCQCSIGESTKRQDNFTTSTP